MNQLHVIGIPQLCIFNAEQILNFLFILRWHHTSPGGQCFIDQLQTFREVLVYNISLGIRHNSTQLYYLIKDFDWVLVHQFTVALGHHLVD